VPPTRAGIIVHPDVYGPFNRERNRSCRDKDGQIFSYVQIIMAGPDFRVVIEPIPRVTSIFFMPPGIVV
jgi:hypothetical protein